MTSHHAGLFYLSVIVGFDGGTTADHERHLRDYSRNWSSFVREAPGVRRVAR